MLFHCFHLCHDVVRAFSSSFHVIVYQYNHYNVGTDGQTSKVSCNAQVLQEEIEKLQDVGGNRTHIKTTEMSLFEV